jgi:kynurenine formamidase
MTVIDLSICLKDNFKMLPHLPRVLISDYFTHEFTAPLYELPCQGCKISHISMPDHIGTHIDAPVHFVPGGKDASQIPIDSLLGDAVIIDVSVKGSENPLTIEMFHKFVKEQNVYIREKDIVIIRCSTRKWNEEGFLSIKSLTSEVADYLIKKNVKALGVDLLTVDSLDDKRRPVHLKLLEKEIFIVEGLINLEKIGKKRFQFIALPLPLVSASGSPTRAIAIIDT